jgi:hypothetical protein
MWRSNDSGRGKGRGAGVRSAHKHPRNAGGGVDPVHEKLVNPTIKEAAATYGQAGGMQKGTAAAALAVLYSRTEQEILQKGYTTKEEHTEDGDIHIGSKWHTLRAVYEPLLCAMAAESIHVPVMQASWTRAIKVRLCLLTFSEFLSPAYTESCPPLKGGHSIQ